MDATDEQRQKIEKVFEDLAKANVPAIRAAAALGISVKAAKKELKKANARLLARVPVAGCQQMTPILARSGGWHSLESLDRAMLTAFSRSDSPVSSLFRPPEADP